MQPSVIQEAEALDFVLELGGRQIGIEVTEFIRGRSRARSAVGKQHAFIKGVLGLAQANFAKHAVTPVWVTIDAAAQNPPALG